MKSRTLTPKQRAVISRHAPPAAADRERLEEQRERRAEHRARRAEEQHELSEHDHD
jgi:hypothetical protein